MGNTTEIHVLCRGISLVAILTNKSIAISDFIEPQHFHLPHYLPVTLG